MDIKVLLLVIFQHRRCGRRPRFWYHFPGIMNSFPSQFTGQELSEYLCTEKLNEMLNQFTTDKPIDETFLLENVGKVLHEILSSYDYSVDRQTEESKFKEKKKRKRSNHK